MGEVDRWCAGMEPGRALYVEALLSSRTKLLPSAEAQPEKQKSRQEKEGSTNRRIDALLGTVVLGDWLHK